MCLGVRIDRCCQFGIGENEQSWCGLLKVALNCPSNAVIFVSRKNKPCFGLDFSFSYFGFYRSNPCFVSCLSFFNIPANLLKFSTMTCLNLGE